MVTTTDPSNFLTLKGIVPVIAKSSTIKELFVEDCNLGYDLDKEVIFSMLSSLKVLCIGRNHLGDEGAELLSEGLPNTKSLEILSICDSNITCRGAKALALALAKNTSLEILDLDSNNIGNQGVVAT